MVYPTKEIVDPRITNGPRKFILSEKYETAIVQMPAHMNGGAAISEAPLAEKPRSFMMVGMKRAIA
jgi:hypothetical protein